jgi:hypothetical protein
MVKDEVPKIGSPKFYQQVELERGDNRAGERSY